jgi:hypothetical protein
MTTSTQGTAVVTDAASGIGAIYADRLARRGYDLVLVARNCERLDDVARRPTTDETGRTVKVVAADLAEKMDLGRIEALLRSDLSISLLVNSASVGVSGPLAEFDVDKMEDMIALNVRALTRLTSAAVPGFVSRGGGTIINIASGVIAPGFLNGVYAGTKAFVLALSLSLHEQLSDKNIRVQFWEIAGHPIEHLPRQIVMQAGDMIDAALAGLDYDELAILSPLPDAADWQAYGRGSEAIRQSEQVEASNDDI